MKQKNKYDFFAINRVMNGNWNGGKSYWSDVTKKLEHNEELKLKRFENKTNKNK